MMRAVFKLIGAVLILYYFIISAGGWSCMICMYAGGGVEGVDFAGTWPYMDRQYKNSFWTFSALQPKYTPFETFW